MSVWGWVAITAEAVAIMAGLRWMARDVARQAHASAKTTTTRHEGGSSVEQVDAAG